MSAPAEPLLRAVSLRSAQTREVSLPGAASQNGKEAGYCLVEDGGVQRQVRFRGDPRLWEWPGVFEHLIRNLLRGNAPGALCHLLDRQLRAARVSPAELRAIDLFAGNGWMGEELSALGISEIVGVDATAAAAAAVERDHPDVYRNYLVLDMRRLSEAQRDELMAFDFNCMTCVDALAADEPAPNAFTEAFNLLAPEGWAAFHLNAETAEGGRDSRFARVVHRMIQSGAMNVITQQRYRHRFSTSGTPIFHVGVVARKVRDFDP
ncbi:MAG TPA: methyltransferase domain-containing protein [Myxococcota bacterium]|nr:methyltransferase domain-containing protein [Myxococcota bacterium]